MEPIFTSTPDSWAAFLLDVVEFSGYNFTAKPAHRPGVLRERARSKPAKTFANFACFAVQEKILP